MAETAGEVKLLLTVDGTTWSAAIDRAQREIDKLKGKTTEAARTTKAEMTEARHAIHLLGDEVGIHLPRALQGFVAKLPGVAEAMAAAFSAVAVIGLGMVIIETGKKVYEFIEKTKKAAEEAKRATEQFTESRHLANLEMAAANARMEEQIAKLEKKPSDGLKTALAEARVEAFKLGQELERDIEQARKLIEEKLSATMFERVALGEAGSEDVLGKLDQYGEKVDEISKILDPAKRTEEMKSYTGEVLKQLHTEIEAASQLQAKRNQMISEAAAAPARTRGAIDQRAEAPEDQTKKLRSLKLFHDIVQEEYNSADLTATRIEDQGRLHLAQDAEERARLAKEALDALKRQTAERMQAMENDLANQKTMHLMTLEEERDFWLKRQYTGTNLGDPINAEITKKIAPLSQAIFKKQIEDAKQWVAMMGELQKEADRLSEKANPFALDPAEMRTKGATESARMAALHDQPELLRRIAQAQDELNASEEVSAGRMEKRTEEIIKQTGVVSRLMDELAELQGKRDAVEAMPQSAYTAAMNPEVLDNQITAKKAELGAAAATLQYEKERDTFGADMQQMFQDWIKRATDLREAMASIFTETMGTINSAIVKTMVDPFHRGDWKEAGKSIFTGIAGKGLTLAEASIMKAAGLGKLGSTKENAMWTRSADVASAATGSIAKTMLNSASSTTASNVAGSVVGKVLGTLLSSVPFMASGGPLESGMPAIVGERGPELFIPSGSGRIIPNDRLGGMNHTWNIDARGSSDPAAVRFAVQRGIMEAAPRIAAGSIAAAQDLSRRKPVMSR